MTGWAFTGEIDADDFGCRVVPAESGPPEQSCRSDQLSARWLARVTYGNQTGLGADSKEASVVLLSPAKRDPPMLAEAAAPAL